MKKVLIFFIALLSILLISCGGFELRGLKEYNPNNSSVSLSQKLLPNEQFVDLFEYENGDYFYFDSGLQLFPEHALERELLYLQYSEQAYINAKEYTINNIDISKKIIFHIMVMNFLKTLNMQITEKWLIAKEKINIFRKNLICMLIMMKKEP